MTKMVQESASQKALQEGLLLKSMETRSSSDGGSYQVYTKTDERELTADDSEGNLAQEETNTVLPVTPDDKLPLDETLLLYNITDLPPWPLSILLGLQHFLLFFGGIVSLPLLLRKPLCISLKDSATGTIISTMFFVSGLNTLLQTTLGVRLPIVQGGTFAFLGPSLSILALPQWQCPNDTFINNLEYEERQELWHSRMRELQGSIIMSSLFEVLIGFSGAIGWLMRFIGPLTIVPTIGLTGLSLFGTAGYWAGKHWGISILVFVLVAFFSQYAPNFPYPCFSERWTRRITQIFQMFPVLIAVVLTWSLCAILTAAGALSDDPSTSSYYARTDTKLETLAVTPWARFPYPFQWGMPTFSLSGISILSGVLAGIVESIGVPPPPKHAINRGIGIEGIGCILAGIWGTGSGTTSYAENIAALGITKVGSRRVLYCASGAMLLIGIFTKFGGLMATMPDPIVGGLYCGIFGMITSVGLSQLQNVNLNSSRNLFVLGFSIFMGLVVPEWIKSKRGFFAGMTGSVELNQITEVLFTTHMFVGGFLACFLDNTIPGSLKDRGMLSASEKMSDDESSLSRRIYGLPFGLSKYLNRCSCSRFLPFVPKYRRVSLPAAVAKVKVPTGMVRTRRKDSFDGSVT